jgi:uncharacterized protein (DUF488 family)
MDVWTIGHSTRGIEEFIELLSAYSIEALADVRRFPASRKHSHFNQGPLSVSLENAGIEYLPLMELGGRRHPFPNSKNTAWRNDSFRGYADYMETDAFHSGIGRLMEKGRELQTVLMCAELLWWRCHRALIADYLKAEGHDVIHILNLEKNIRHPYTSAARVEDGKLSYAEVIGS